MDFEKYYNTQATEKLPVFKGSRYQRGFGFGNVFRKLFRWIVPIVKENATPILKNMGKSAIKTAVNIASDTLEGQNFRTSAKGRIKESLKNLGDQYGKGKKKHYKKTSKNKKNITISKKRKIRDIFD